MASHTQTMMRMDSLKDCASNYTAGEKWDAQFCAGELGWQQLLQPPLPAPLLMSPLHTAFTSYHAKLRQCHAFHSSHTLAAGRRGTNTCNVSGQQCWAQGCYVCAVSGMLSPAAPGSHPLRRTRPVQGACGQACLARPPCPLTHANAPRFHLPRSFSFRATAVARWSGRARLAPPATSQLG